MMNGDNSVIGVLLSFDSKTMNLGNILSLVLLSRSDSKYFKLESIWGLLLDAINIFFFKVSSSLFPTRLSGRC